MKKLFQFITNLKVKAIRPDLAKHDFVGGYISFFFITWITVLFGILPGIITAFVLIALYGMYELGQKATGTGEASVNDWLASSRTAFMMLTMLVIAYTKWM